jgi:hypothetical protein
MLPVGDPPVHGIVNKGRRLFLPAKNPMPLHNPSDTMVQPIPTIEAEHAYRLGSIAETFTDEIAESRDRIEILIERYPWPTVMLALAVGYLFARRMR